MTEFVGFIVTAPTGSSVRVRAVPLTVGGLKMSLRFREEEFQAAWRELDEPQLEEGWQLFTKTTGVEIYRRHRPVGNRHKTARFYTGTTAANRPNKLASVSAEIVINSTIFFMSHLLIISLSYCIKR